MLRPELDIPVTAETLPLFRCCQLGGFAHAACHWGIPLQSAVESYVWEWLENQVLIINKIDLAPYVGASLAVMEQDTLCMRGDKPFVFSNMKTGQGVDEIVRFIEREGMLEE